MAAPATDASPTRLAPRTLWWLASGLAMVSALWFTLRGATKVFLLGGFGAISRDVLWMSPLGHLVLFVVAAVPLLLVTRALSAPRGLFLAVTLLGAMAVHAVLLPWTQLGIYAAIVLSLGAGTALARALGRRGESGTQRLMRGLALGIGACFAMGALGTSITGAVRGMMARRALPPAPAGAPNVVFLVLDTFRASTMSTYGSTRGLTPALDALAARGTTFEWAMSNAGWTLPAHATLFTGHYQQRLNTDFDRALNTREPVIAEAFAAHGYETAGFVGNLHYTSWESGLARGFQHWEDYPRSWEMVLKSTLHGQTVMVEEMLRATSRARFLRGLRRKRLMVQPKPEGPPVQAAEITDRFLSWHRGRDASRPFFAFFNYFDAHRPYLAPAPYARTQADEDTTMAGYERDVRYMDGEIARMLASLDSAGALANTLIVVTADHGEHFGERGLYGHANSVYTRLLHVPLVFVQPGKVPVGRVSSEVSLRDVPATILELAGLRDATYPGHSLAAVWAGSSAARSAVIAQHLPSSGRDPAEPASEQGMTAVLDGTWHWVRTMRRAIEEVYRYREDPDEVRSLVGTDSAMHSRDALLDRYREAIRSDLKSARANNGGAGGRD